MNTNNTTVDYSLENSSWDNLSFRDILEPLGKSGRGNTVTVEVQNVRGGTEVRVKRTRDAGDFL